MHSRGLAWVGAGHLTIGVAGKEAFYNLEVREFLLEGFSVFGVDDRRATWRARSLASVVKLLRERL
jgi:hypothetical protein